jgi:hypothetical protein
VRARAEEDVERRSHLREGVVDDPATDARPEGALHDHRGPRDVDDLRAQQRPVEAVAGDRDVGEAEVRRRRPRAEVGEDRVPHRDARSQGRRVGPQEPVDVDAVDELQPEEGLLGSVLTVDVDAGDVGRGGAPHDHDGRGHQRLKERLAALAREERLL